MSSTTKYHRNKQSHCRWEYDQAGCVAVSVWPQSGQADLAKLGLALLSDQKKEEEEEEEERVGNCPLGLYWCRDTCYTHSVCYQSPHRPTPDLTDSDLRSGMSEDSRPDQSQGGLKVDIVGPSECKVGEEIPVEVVVETEESQQTVEIVVVPSHQYQVSQPVRQLSVVRGEVRSLVVWLEVRSQGEVPLLLTVGGQSHRHLLQAVRPGNTRTEHTSLLVDLTHHNTWAQHHLAINNHSLNTIITLSVTGDILGPLILEHIKPPVSLLSLPSYHLPKKE